MAFLALLPIAEPLPAIRTNLMRIKLTFIIIISLVILSCEKPKNKTELFTCGVEPMPKYDYRATIEGEMTPEIDSILRIEKKRNVFEPCRIFEYRAKFYTEDGQLLSNEIIKVLSPGKRWEYQTEKQDKIVIKYNFNPDSINYINSFQLNKTRINPNWNDYVFTGIIENVEKIWTHPFRSNQYNFTQVAPFPQVELPLKIGNTWNDNKISLRNGFGDWDGMKVKSKFEVIELADIKTEYGVLKNSWKIKAKSTFPLGESELIYWFNEKYGFVKLDYTNYGNQKLLIEMINVNKTAGNTRL